MMRKKRTKVAKTGIEYIPVAPPVEKLCFKFPNKVVECPGGCKGATIRWQWETCGYGKRVQNA